MRQRLHGQHGQQPEQPTDLGTRSDAATDVAIQPDGRIVAIGTNDQDGSVMLARYLPDGTLDPTFGGAGKVVGGVRMLPNGVLITPAGTILVAGADGADAIVAGYAPDGSLNLGFGQSGVARADVSHGGLDFGEDLVLDAHGDIVVVGSATSATVSDMALIRFTPDGAFDRAVTADFNGFGDHGYAITIDPHGRIVAAGSGGGQFALMRAFF